jgi:hypothetical protein
LCLFVLHAHIIEPCLEAEELEDILQLSLVRTDELAILTTRPLRYRGRLVCLAQSGRKMRMKESLRKEKAEQERRAQQAARRADEILSASYSRMRKAERAPREALYRAEMLKWRIEGGGLRPRQPRSLELGGARREPFQTKGLGY